MPDRAARSATITRLAALTPRAEWVEPLVRALGCGCPTEVFAQLARPDPGELGCEAVLAIGGRLLVGFAGAGRCDSATQIFRLARAYRDRHGYNRFRLVLVGEATEEQLAAAGRAAASAGERLHVHRLDEEALATRLPADTEV